MKYIVQRSFTSLTVISKEYGHTSPVETPVPIEICSQAIIARIQTSVLSPHTILCAEDISSILDDLKCSSFNNNDNDEDIQLFSGTN